MCDSYHLKVDIKVIKLVNLVDQGLDHGKLFIRYYIPALLGNRKIKVDTKEIQSKNSVVWNESASFECHVNSGQIEQLELGHVTFELRSRKSRQLFGGIMARSKLLGKGDVSWKDVMGSRDLMEVQRWVNLSAKGGKLNVFKLPDLLVEMKVQVTRDVHSSCNKKRCSSSSEKCGWIEPDFDMYHVETIVD